MPHREAVGEDYPVLIEGVYVLDQIGQREPHLVLLGVEEPGTRLPMQVDEQVEDQLEKPQRELNALRRIQEADNLGEPEDSNNLYEGKEPEFV